MWGWYGGAEFGVLGRDGVGGVVNLLNVSYGN